MKNVDNLMALKKNLKNTIKFGVHNIPSSMIQVKNGLINVESSSYFILGLYS